MNILTISIGSNSNDKEKQINNCLLWIKANFDFIAVSDIYNSPATNGKDPDYMNAVAIIKSEESHQNLVKISKTMNLHVEEQMTAKSKVKYLLTLTSLFGTIK